MFEREAGAHRQAGAAEVGDGAGAGAGAGVSQAAPQVVQPGQTPGQHGQHGQQSQQVKRRRVTRACDECRKKKVKCDGQQPCIHCTVYSYECTYNQPTKRNQSQAQGPSQGQSQSQSQSQQQAFQRPAQVSATRPGATGDATGAALHSHTYASTPGIATPTLHAASPVAGGNVHKKSSSGSSGSKLQTQLSKYKKLVHEILPNLPDIESLDLPTFSQIYQNFNSDSGGSSIFNDTVKEYNLIVSHTTPLSSTTTSPEGSTSVNSNCINSDVIESVDGSIQSTVGREIKIILPPKPIALQFLKNAWEHCCVLLRFYHRPTFIKQLDELYETDPQNYSHDQMEFLPLCYSTMAVGALFSKSIDTESNSNEEDLKNARDKFLEDEGYKYFIAARKLIDITNARDLNSIQTILMLFIFLQCSARLSTCYAYIGVAMRSALREGLHRCLNADSGFSPIEIEMRKRLFFTIHKLDIYVNAMLGLPRSIAPCDYDQVLPVELSDENITEEGYFSVNQNGVLSSAGIANQHTKLILILDVIVRELYPIKKTNNLISHEVVTELELKLRNWLDGLPPELIPGLKSVPKKYETANRLLHLSFLHVQLILYRPFIHYLSRKVVANHPDSLSIQRARNSISVARTVVNLAKGMVKKNLLIGSYWYGNYTIFYSVAGLLFYIHEAQPSDKESAKEYNEILKDAELGRNVLLQLKDSSMAANRTYNLLNKLFERLNSKTIKLSATHGIPTENLSQQSKQQQQQQQQQQKPVNQIPLPVNCNDNQNPLPQQPNPYSLENYIDANFAAGLQNQVSPQANSSVQSPLKRVPNTAKTISGVNTINTAATSNITGNENDIFLNSDTTPLDGLFMFDNNTKELFTDNPSTNNSLKGLDQMSLPSEQMNNPNVADSPKLKAEPIDSESYIPGMFDQLDIQLFGRYLPPYMSQQNANDQQATPQSDFKQ